MSKKDGFHLCNKAENSTSNLRLSHIERNHYNIV
jgi:hypothetical protein